MTTVSTCPAESKLDHLNTQTLPALPGGVPYLIKALTNENIDYDELASTIEKYPSISGKLLSLANSAWSAPVCEVTSIKEACCRLGLGVVRSTAIALAVAAPFYPGKCPSFDSEYFWCNALLTAEAASRLVSNASPAIDLDPSTARAAGLLHNLGFLWLADEFSDEVQQALQAVRNKQANSLHQALTDRLGFDHVEVSGHLAKIWSLPAPLAEAMGHYPDLNYQGTQREIVNTVGIATSLVSAILKDGDCPAHGERMSSINLGNEALMDIFEQLKTQLLKLREIAKLLID